MHSSYKANIWKYYFYQFFSGFFLIESIVILFYLTAGINYFQLGLINVLGYLTLVVLEIPSGSIADMLGRKNALFVGLFLVGVELVVIAAGFSIGFFLLASVIGGIGTSLISGSDTALLYDSLKTMRREKEFKRIYGKGRSLMFFSVVVATAVGSFLYALDHQLVFYINGGFFMLGACIALTMYEPRINKETFSFAKQWRHIVSSMDYVFTHPKLRWMITFSIFSGAFISVFHNMLRQPYMKEIGIDIALFGVLTASIYLLRSLVSYKAHAIEEVVGERVSLVLIVFLQSVLFFVMATFPLVYSFIFVVLIYCVWTYKEIVIEDYYNQHMTQKQRATLLSIHSFFRSIVLVISFLIVGLLIDVFSLSASLYLLSGLSLLFGSALLLRRNHSSVV